ncbi:GGDEF domain-containing protein [Gayadomonas joobiniege]|uniref:GGDEF domain-containing protein n=1 Tax=Gayadomonas joobiniege TaxID=1234606 RepID=UPI0003669AEA|nr:GGDEF domain-containing protein [Gayadomonas joobiniege]
MDYRTEVLSDIDERKLIIKYFSIIGGLTTLVMGIIGVINHNYPLFLALLGSSLLFFLSAVLSKHGQMNHSASIILYTLYVLMFYLVLTGGHHGTGPVWCFIVPLVTFFLRGLKQGTLDIVIFTLISFVLINISIRYYNYFGAYDDRLVSLYKRLFIAFIIVTILTALYEYFRSLYNRKLADLAEQNQELANKDTLTNLPNRRCISDHFSNKKTLKKTYSIVLIDIDNFKQINDQYGHDVGDKALQHFSKIFTLSSRQTDTAARWGGEEFLLVLEQTNKLGATQFVQKLQNQLSSYPLKVDNLTVCFTFSAGIAEIAPDTHFDQAIKQADDLLYKAKRGGKNKVLSD